jgi:hypothetical protein
MRREALHDGPVSPYPVAVRQVEAPLLEAGHSFKALHKETNTILEGRVIIPGANTKAGLRSFVSIGNEVLSANPMVIAACGEVEGYQVLPMNDPSE